jgi:AraC-like DNA-binding protein
MDTKTTIARPQLEKIDPGFGSSFNIRIAERKKDYSDPFWHYHPELELAYIIDGKGKLHVGNHISFYNNGGLILIGPNLPHYGFTDRLSRKNNQVVIQMKEDFMGNGFLNIPEAQAINDLFKRSRSGISFHGNTKKKVGQRILDLPHMNPLEKITSLIHILSELGESKEYKSLNAEGMVITVQSQDNDRLDLIYNHVRSNFDGDIPLEEVAGLVNMTVPSFCRFFKKVTKKTFVSFLNEVRIVHACKLISEEKMTITEVCYECGFNNFSHFTKSFRKITGYTPSDYRKSLSDFYHY